VLVVEGQPPQRVTSRCAPCQQVASALPCERRPECGPPIPTKWGQMRSSGALLHVGRFIPKLTLSPVEPVGCNGPTAEIPTLPRWFQDRPKLPSGSRRVTSINLAYCSYRPLLRAQIPNQEKRTRAVRPNQNRQFISHRKCLPVPTRRIHRDTGDSQNLLRNPRWLRDENSRSAKTKRTC
jgi:hypothetical protein